LEVVERSARSGRRERFEEWKERAGLRETYSEPLSETHERRVEDELSGLGSVLEEGLIDGRDEFGEEELDSLGEEGGEGDEVASVEGRDELQ